MAITRRQFLKYAAASAAALGLSELELFQLAEKVMASDSKPSVIALQGQACSGDITALANLLNGIPPTVLNSFGYGTWTHSIAGYAGGAVENYLGSAGGATTSVDDVLIDIIDLKFHPTVCAPAGALGYKEGVIDASGSGHILLIEGSIPVGTSQTTTTVGAESCKIGDQSGDGDGEAESMAQAVATIINKGNTLAILAVGTCAAYGGIPAGKNGNAIEAGTKSTPKYRSSGAMSVSDALKALSGIGGPITGSLPAVVNIPGCPARPEDVFLVVAQAIIDLPDANFPGLVGSLNVPLDGDGTDGGPVNGRPGSILGINLFGQTQHYHCSRRAAYISSDFATSFADTSGKCLAILGCKGPTTFASCQRNKKHQWNPSFGDGATQLVHDSWPSSAANLGSVTNDGGGSCIKRGHPCIGCKEKGFPDRFAPLVDYNN